MCEAHIIEYKCVETRYFPITATTPTTPRQMPNSAPFTHMIKVSINITYHQATAILHDNFLASGNLPQPKE
jgi:hypothetical protein